MEIIGQISDTLLICVNNGSCTSLTTFSTSSAGNEYESDAGGGAGESFRQLFLLNLNDTISSTSKNTSTTASTTTTTKPRSYSHGQSGGGGSHGQTVQPFIFIPVPSTASHVIHASLHRLHNPNDPPIIHGDGDFLLSTSSSSFPVAYSLMAVVYHRLKQEQDESTNSYYSVMLYLLETAGTDVNAHAHASAKISSHSKTIIIEKFQLVKEQRAKLHAHVLPCNPEPVSADVLTPASSTSDLATSQCFQRYVNRILVLHLHEGFTIFQMESTPVSVRPDVTRISTKMELLSSECIPKSFWWAQWNPDHQFLAFTHKQKLRQSPSMEYPVTAGAPQTLSQPRKRVLDAGTLSVYQLHTNYPRESVLNFPLPKYEEQILSSKQEFFKPTCALEFNPFVLASAPSTPQQQLRILMPPPTPCPTNTSNTAATTTGTVYVFQLLPTASGSSFDNPNQQQSKDSHYVKYVVHILHHNKSLSGTITCQPNLVHGAYHIGVDVCLIKNGQFLVIVGWPLFAHVLDVGSDHEPSHHLIFNANSLHSFIPATVKEPSTISLAMLCPTMTNEKDSSHSHAFRLIFNFNANNNLQVQPIELNSSLLLPLVENEKADIQFKLSVLHFLMIHANDVGSAKRVLQFAGQCVENVWLSKLFQEFLIAHAFAQTRSQLLPSTKRFLHLLPYCPPTNGKDTYETPSYRLELKPIQIQVSAMLLSPNQRIFSQSTTDLWTALWDLSFFLGQNKRFSHKTIADKLLISLQCYKPEVLSRATTPMSPSSPMVWSSVPGSACGSTTGTAAGTTGLDLLSPFGTSSGKRGQETQQMLPFTEHESCTANKQEYIYSINLRELSMHLLKERKDCPVHGHTIGGRYVNSLVNSSRLLCHLICSSMVQLPTNKSKAKDKGFRLIDSLTADARLRLFLLLEHYSLGVTKLACPFPNGFSSFFAYLGYRVLQYEQFLWHVRSGTFDLQIDLIKMIMADMNDSDPANVNKKLRLISLLSKSRAGRVLNSWSHPKAICIRARQHSADLLAGNVVFNSRRGGNTIFSSSSIQQQQPRMRHKASAGGSGGERENNAPPKTQAEKGPLATFFNLLAAKANPGDIDLPLLTEAMLLSTKIDN